MIEGLDRSGKSTQAATLLEVLQSRNIPVKFHKFPGAYDLRILQELLLMTLFSKDRVTPIGQMIDSYLRSESELDDHVIHLLFSANRWELAYVQIHVHESIDF